MDLREEFVLRAKALGANVAELCRDHGISRKTGYKWIGRYNSSGIEGLAEMSRRPRRVVQVSGEIVLRVQELRRAHPSWGPKKLRVLLLRRELNDVPSVKTISRILERLGEPKLRRPRRKLQQVDRTAPKHDIVGPNDLWTVDFKGWWHTQGGEHCEPLTVRDAFSRYVLCCKVMTSTALAGVRQAFERLFQQYGLPTAIHVDNGSPFGSTRARGGLTQLSAWWVALGIRVVFSRPGQPQDNGGHERMHGDMSIDLEQDAAVSNDIQQQACDHWVHEFNHVRPHEALSMKTPAELYQRSTRPFRGIRTPRFRMGIAQRKVDCSGHVHLESRAPFVGAGFAGYRIGLERIDENIVRLWFYEMDLGIVDLSDAPMRRLGLRSSDERLSTRATRKKRRTRSTQKKSTSSCDNGGSVSPRSCVTKKRRRKG